MQKLKPTPRKRRWAEPRHAVLKGLPLKPSAAPRARYQAGIAELLERMHRDYARQLGRLWDDHPELTQDANPGSQARILLNMLGRKWGRIFMKVADTLTERLVTQVDRTSKAALSSSLKELSGAVTLKLPDMPESLKPVISASIAENVALIKSVGVQFHQRIESKVYASIQTGGAGRATILKELRKVKGLADDRAKLIARDQTSKISAAYNAERAKAVGMRKFQWLHSGGGVDKRELHLKLNGQIFSYDDPPVIDERTGERGLPGQLINCRCVAVPVIDFGDEDLT